MNDMKVFSIGKIVNEEENVKVVVEQMYTEGSKGLVRYNHVQILWWMDGCDNASDRGILVEEKSYKNGPNEIGIFALRSPERPNLIAVSNVNIAYVDGESGTIGLYYVDVFDGSKVIDIKPYTPSIATIEHPVTLDWCAHWPKSYEESSNFDWKSKFNF